MTHIQANDTLVEHGLACPAYLRLQGNRCQRLSRSCMDLSTARDLRLMADEYFLEAVKVQHNLDAVAH